MNVTTNKNIYELKKIIKESFSWEEVKNKTNLTTNNLRMFSKIFNVNFSHFNYFNINNEYLHKGISKKKLIKILIKIKKWEEIFSYYEIKTTRNGFSYYFKLRLKEIDTKYYSHLPLNLFKQDSIRYKNYSKEQLNSYIKESNCFAEVIRKMGLKPSSGSTITLKKKIKELNLDTKHFQGRLVGLDKKNLKNIKNNNLKLENILIKNSTYTNTHKLKLRLFKEKIKKKICEKCGIKNWMGEKISLQLHHKDGDKTNNLLENLEILCPNCHSQTENFVSKNKKYDF
jgi:Zn finger protein HypA/HybF involved in hydrogenase expression